MRGIKFPWAPLSGKRNVNCALYNAKETGLSDWKAAIGPGLQYSVYRTFSTQPGNVNAHCERSCDLRSLLERIVFIYIAIAVGVSGKYAGGLEAKP